MPEYGQCQVFRTHPSNSVTQEATCDQSAHGVGDEVDGEVGPGVVDLGAGSRPPADAVADVGEERSQLAGVGFDLGSFAGLVRQLL